MAARIKTKKLSLGGKGGEGINEQFTQMLGNGPLDLEIIAPKYEDVYEHVNLIISVIRSFYTFISKASPGSEKDLDNLERKRFRWKEYLDENYTKDIKLLEERYKTLKKSFVIDDIIVLYGDLKPYEKYIKDNDGSFIEDSPGSTFEIFTDNKLDIKKFYLYSHEEEGARARIQQYILKCFNMVLDSSHTIYKLVTSPDVDISSISEFLIKALVDVKKHIPRCDDAFAKIAESVEHLEDNFGDYYKDYVETGSQTIIMENFVNDILKKYKGNLQLARQFREIIKFLRTRVQKSKAPKDPKLRKIFEEIDAFDQKISKKESDKASK